MKTLLVLTLFCALGFQNSYAGNVVIKCTDVDTITDYLGGRKNQSENAATMELKQSTALTVLIDRGAKAQMMMSFDSSDKNNVGDLLSGALSDNRLGRRVSGYVVSRTGNSATVKLTLVTAERGQATVQVLNWNLELGQKSIVVETTDTTQHTIACKVDSN